MNPLVHINANFYFEVKDSAIFGGEGTTGYTAINLEGVKDVAKLTDEYIEAQIVIAAKICKVPKASVKLISKEEYDNETEEDEELDNDDWEN